MRPQAPRLLLLTALALAISACGRSPTPPADAPAAAAEAPAADAPVTVAAPPADALPLPRRTAPEGARVTILSPADGAVVTSPVKVVFGLEGMTVVPAGDATPNSGHHHLLVDVPAPDLGLTIPKDAQHLHFGQAQTEAEVTLTPGQHTLQLLLGDADHVPHNPPVISAPITITVQ